MRTLFIPVLDPRNSSDPRHPRRMIHLRKRVDDAGKPVRIDVALGGVALTDDPLEGSLLALEAVAALRGLPKAVPAAAPSIKAVAAKGARERRERIVAAWRRGQDQNWAETQSRNADIWKAARRLSGVAVSAIDSFSA
jgi:hypothetical protein